MLAVAYLPKRPSLELSTPYMARPRRIGKKEAMRRVMIAAVIGLAGLAAGACTISFPMMSLIPSSETTGSIAQQVSPLSPKLEGEDWRRAKAALNTALDPTGNGAPVAWSNPETATKGSFAPVGQAFVKSDELCRGFIASLSFGAKEEWLQGAACRVGSEDWTLQDVKPAQKPS